MTENAGFLSEKQNKQKQNNSYSISLSSFVHEFPGQRKLLILVCILPLTLKKFDEFRQTVGGVKAQGWCHHIVEDKNNETKYYIYGKSMDSFHRSGAFSVLAFSSVELNL